MARATTIKNRRILWLCVSLGAALLLGVSVYLVFRPRLVLPELTANSILVLNCGTGRTVYEKDSDVSTHPASLTKLMTMYLIFEDLANGRISLSDELIVIPNESESLGSQYGLKNGEHVTVEQLIAGTILNSGCDCVQGLIRLESESETEFVSRMNEKAETLGLKDTYFENATGIDSSNHLSTAEDLAQLSLALIQDYPEYLDYSSNASMHIDGMEFTNCNKLVGADSRVLGLKTGTSFMADCNLITLCTYGGETYLIVLLGCDSDDLRFQETETIMDALWKEA